MLRSRLAPLPSFWHGLAVLSLALLTLPACSSDQNDTTDDPASPNTLTQAERDAGWTLLFDGEHFDHWTGLGRDTIPEGHWTIEDGAIRKIDSGEVPKADDGQPLEGGDIMTEDTYRNFELKLEWKASKGGNSGIKYNVSDSLSTAHEPQYAALGFEYQLLDDERHPDSEDPTHRAAGLYDLLAPNDAKSLKPVGEWNEARVVLRGMHGEHWLNGEKVVEYDMNTARFDSLFAASKYADIEGFRTRRAGHLVLQDHGDDFWFRNVKIRRLPADQ